MNLLINRGSVSGDWIAHAVKAVYYKAGCADLIERTDGLTRSAVLVIYELAD